MRPWTRMECARLVDEAEDRIVDDDREESEPARLDGALQREFVSEINWLGGGNNAEVRLESAYTRSTEIVGRYWVAQFCSVLQCSPRLGGLHHRYVVAA
jgi:hypothetical protein